MLIDMWNLVNDVQKYVSLESIREIEDESLINSKIDLILSGNFISLNLWVNLIFFD